METIDLINKRFMSAFNNETINAKTLDKNDLFLISDKYIIPYLNLIKEHKKIYKLIHDNPHIFNNQKAFKNLYNNLFEVILEKYGVLDEEKEYVFAYFSFGILAVVNKWLERDCVDDVTKIAEYMKKFIGYNIDK